MRNSRYHNRRNGPSQTFPPLGETPFISIVIPVRNEERFAEQCIRTIKKLDYPSERLEVIFADGRSTDRTVEILRAHGCQVMDNPGLSISAGRNAGFAASKGDIVVFTDADCILDPQWLRKAIRYFRMSNEVGGLSGPTPVPEDQNNFGKAVGIVFDIAGMAGGTTQRSNRGEPQLVDDLPGCNSFYRREALLLVMPSDTSLYASEDVQMSSCLQRCGVKLMMTPDVAVQHYKRTEPGRFLRQIYAFAVGRMQLGKRDVAFLKPTHWVMGVGFPLALVAVIAAGFFWSHVWAWVAILGALIIVMLAIPCSIAYTPAVGFNVLLAAALLVTVWPVGFLREFFFPIGRK